MVTINEAAYGFSENMKALHGNYFLKGYFKRKAKNAANDAPDSSANDLDAELNEEELRTIIADAQRELDAKKNKKP